MNSAVFCARLALLLDELDGIDPVLALADTDFDRSLLEAPDAFYIDQVSERTIYENVAQLTQSPWLGFVAGQRVNFSDMGPLGLALVSSNTVGEMLSFNEKYLRTVTPPCLFEIKVVGPKLLLRTVESYPMLPKMQRLAAEEVLAVWVNFPADGLVEAASALRVSFESPAHPEHLQHYAQLLPGGLSKVHFNWKFKPGKHKVLLEVELPTAVLDLPMPRPRADIHAANKAYCEARLDSLNDEGQWSQRVRDLLIANYTDTVNPVWRPHHIALALEVTLRQLQRNLEREGTTPQALVADVRRALVEDFVLSKLTNKQLGRIIGMSEKHFISWFGGQYGCSRTEYRAAAMSVEL